MSTVVLHEKDSAYVAGPISFAISEGGDFIVVDKFSRRGYRFNRKGDLLLVYGRPGQGPGELEMPFQSFASGDTLLGIIDDAKQSVQVYDARTGRFVRSRRYDGYIGSTLVVGNTVFLGGTNAARERGLKRWDLAADSLTYLVAFPTPYHRNAELATIYSSVGVAVRAGQLVVGFSADPAILVTDAEGTPLDSFRLPATRRRDIPPDLERSFVPTLDAEKRIGAASDLNAISFRADGSIIFVHFDHTFLPPRSVAARIFVSVLSADLQTACVDGELVSDAAEGRFGYGAIPCSRFIRTRAVQGAERPQSSDTWSTPLVVNGFRYLTLRFADPRHAETGHPAFPRQNRLSLEQ